MIKCLKILNFRRYLYWVHQIQKVILVFLYLMNPVQILAQNLPLASINVKNNTDRLKNAVEHTTGIEQLKSLLALDRNITIWERHQLDDNMHLDELIVKYELQKKEDKNIYLQNEKENVETKNTLYLLLGTISLTGFILTGFLAFNLKKENTKINISIKKIDQLNKTREHFYSIIAHDLRRPMHAYQGMAELVSYHLRAKRYDAIEMLSDSIDDSGKEIQQMLDNLLAWSLSQREEVPYNPKEVNLLPKIRFIVDFYEKTLIRKSIQFKVNCPSLLLAFIDPNVIELILRNLIDNAFKSFSSKGGVISIDAYLNKSSNITLIINNNGASIDSIKLTEIRKVFLDPVNIHPGQHGLGLGIILVARFLHRNKCTIEIESSIKVGTTLEITMPTL